MCKISLRSYFPQIDLQALSGQVNDRRRREVEEERRHNAFGKSMCRELRAVVRYARNIRLGLKKKNKQEEGRSLLLI